MKGARWLLTKEGSASTPVLSAAIAAVAAGLLAGVIYSFRISEGWGVVFGVGCAVAVFLAAYPPLRKEHDRQRTADRVSAPVPFRDRARSVRPAVGRIALLFVALPIGVLLSIAFESAWALVFAIVAALIGGLAMHRIGAGRT